MRRVRLRGHQVSEQLMHGVLHLSSRMYWNPAHPPFRSTGY